jgi:hypothetical protein
MSLTLSLLQAGTPDNSGDQRFTLAPIGAILFYCFPDMPRAAANGDLTRRRTFRVGLLYSLVRERFGSHYIGQVRKTHLVPEIFVFLQAALGLQGFGALVEQRDVGLVGDVGKIYRGNDAVALEYGGIPPADFRATGAEPSNTVGKVLAMLRSGPPACAKAKHLE